MFCCCFVLFFESESLYVTHAGLKFPFLLLQPLGITEKNSDILDSIFTHAMTGETIPVITGMW